MERNKIIEVIGKIMATNYACDNVEPDKNLRDNYGIDSISIIDLLMEIEKEYNIKIEPENLNFENFATVNLISEYVFNEINNEV